MDLSKKSILVTGGNGFLGSFVVDELKKKGASDVYCPSSKECDLRINEECKKAIRGIDVVFHLAGKGGGIQFMRNNPADVFYDNLLMSTHLIHESKNEGVEKFIALGTVCSYPKFAKLPFTEDNIWEGYPEETNASYGLSKKMMLVQSQAYKQQYDFNSIVLFPTNLYGPLDNFDLENSHVIPGLITKINLAKIKIKNQYHYGVMERLPEIFYTSKMLLEVLFWLVKNMMELNQLILVLKMRYLSKN